MNAYVLIGGRSRRMGTSKADLFLDRIVDAARPVFDDVIAVDRADGVARDGIRTIFESPHDGEAPVFGVQRALEDARDRAFLLAVDYPFITSDVLRFLRDDGGVPMWDGEPQPLCCVWDASILPRIAERIARGALDLRGLLGKKMIAEAELRARFAGEPLRNVNSAEEWKSG
ncbi:MAG TPA: molybdenum cofactor guanylyltransferase [Thermoanaerobaculia bacterium]|nr:molybdenum cofactor guanylyltransferase [Thermoanaerobaculia bacterium]